MTPRQIVLVEETMAAVPVDELAEDFYRRAFERDRAVAQMFRAEPEVQRARFAAELAMIVRSIRAHDDFLARATALGVRHRGYGVQSAHYRLMGEVLLEALAATLGDRWNPEVEEAWEMAYNLVAETMMLGADEAAG